jgi:DNA-binding PadR family transcriptional regulator
MYSKHSHRHPRHPGHHGREEFARGRGFDFGPGFGPGPRRGRGGPRARRGDVRAAVLALLADRPMHGYEMIKEIEERSDGAWTPSAGSIYPMLQLLEDEGLIRGEDSDGKRRFSLTDSGRTEQAEKAADVAPWDAVKAGFPAGQLQLRSAIGQLVPAVKTLAQDGTEAQQQQAREILDEARRKLYAILAESPAQDQK